MKLQILVPQYNETDDICRNLLDSINMQQGVPMNEFGVIICNDGSDIFLSDELLSSYRYPIEYHKEPHRGVSGTRNACLDYATADYVMFCDADDMFFNSLAFWIIFDEINSPFDCLVSKFVEEVNDVNHHFYNFIHHENDLIFVHGKAFRRQFLLENNIRFDDRLTVNEDSYFNVIAQAISKRTVYVDTAFYLWKFRMDSVSRNDPKHLVKTYRNLLDSEEAMLQQFLRRRMEKEAISLVASFIFDTFYSLNKPDWVDPENQTYRDFAERYFASYFQRYRYIFEKIPESDRIKISGEVRARNIKEGMRMERTSFPEWIEHIEQLSQEERKQP